MDSDGWPHPGFISGGVLDLEGFPDAALRVCDKLFFGDILLKLLDWFVIEALLDALGDILPHSDEQLLMGIMELLVSFAARHSSKRKGDE